MPKARQLSIDELRLWKPSEDDFKYGELLLITEDDSKTIDRYCSDPDYEYSSENMLFKSLVYVISSLREKYDANKRHFNEFLSSGICTVKKVLENPEVLEKMLQEHGLGNKKFESIYSAATEWHSLDILTKMRSDPDKKNGPELRLELMKKIKGVGFKLTSLFLRMHSYYCIVPPDTWAINYVRSRGCVNDGIPTIDKWAEKYIRENGRITHRTDSGLTLKQGLAYEEVLTHYAEKYSVYPVHFQATIYARFSTWKKDAHADPWYLKYL
jgi:thermostable 8-oxoguanine DNA glycosylase